MKNHLRRTAAVVLLGFATVGPITRPVSAQVAALPPDLALVPADALGFAHVRLAEIWANPELKHFRRVFEKAGPKALAVLDDQFVPKPSTVDRVTAVALPMAANGPPKLVAIVRFTAPFDPAAVRKAHAPQGKPVAVGKAQITVDEQARLGLYFPDDRTVAFAEPEVLSECLTLAQKPDGALAGAVRAAAGKSLSAVVNVSRVPLPPGIGDRLPDDFKPLLKAQLVSATLALGKEAVIEAKVVFPTPEDAVEGERALRAAANFARQSLPDDRARAEVMLQGNPNREGPRPLEELPDAVAGLAILGVVEVLDEFFENPPVKADGNTIAVPLTLPAWTTQYLGSAALSTGLMLPAVQKLRESAAKSQSMNNLKQIALAMHNHHDQFLKFPKAAILDKNTGKPLLSWRVAILPYLEQDALYRQFKLDEPWDSEHNKKLIPLMPKVYADPRVPMTVAGRTYYKAFVGADTPLNLDPKKDVNLATITDGSSNTLLVLAGGNPVTWTKPEDFEFDPKKPLPDLLKPFRNLLVAFCDGSVRSLDGADEKTLKALITASGGEVVNVR